jgi:hypothetical protein
LLEYVLKTRDVTKVHKTEASPPDCTDDCVSLPA